MKDVSLWVSTIELAFLSSVVGEAWEAVRRDETQFKARTGETYERASRVRSDLCRILRESEQRSSDQRRDSNYPLTATEVGTAPLGLTLTVDDTRLLCKAAEVTLAALDASEFQTRTAATPEEATAVLNRLRATLVETAV
jgi:hypothetical protein